MKSYLLAILMSGFLFLSCGPSKKVGSDLATNNQIMSQIDLSAIENDKVPVLINPGRFVQDTVFYRMPKVIPGTYAVSDFGNFIENFEAYDYEGNLVEYKKLDNNSWAIYGAKSLDRISYLVNDTFDVEGGDIPTPFSPTGTNIHPDNYVLNLPGFIGYFDGFQENAYQLEVIAPETMDKTSSLTKISEQLGENGNVSTIYNADRYFEVIDNPMMYGHLDIEEFEVGGIKVLLSVYSPNKLHSAKSLKEAMYKMMKAQKTYLGEINSTSRYDIYVYLADKSEGAPRGFGALEHHTSTVVVMPESMPAASLEKGMIDVVSHEFFHILSPLTVHSEDVHYFDYNDPTFSKHLWMYEGLTEYFANLFQVNQGLIGEDEFYSKMMNKISTASRLDDTMSFTVMSENILDQPYKANYYNVYQKGALIGMCLDIILREESKGERGILSVMKELSEKYGVDQPFEDDRIIDEITAMTYPAVGQFFKDHVIGTNPIDYEQYFERAGLSLQQAEVETNYIQNAGAMIVKGDHAAKSVVFNELVTKNSFWNENGALPNDKIKAIDGVEVTMGNANTIFGEVYGWEPGRDVQIVLERDGNELVIEKTLTPTYTTGKLLKRNADMTTEQKNLLESWLKGS